jgi:hypothetical protein
LSLQYSSGNNLNQPPATLPGLGSLANTAVDLDVLRILYGVP